MSATEYVKKTLEKVKPKKDETILELAERLYNIQQEAYDEYCGFTLSGFPYFHSLRGKTRQSWIDSAKKKLKLK